MAPTCSPSTMEAAVTTEATKTRLHHIATFLINTRYAIVGLFVLITIGMMFAMSQL